MRAKDCFQDLLNTQHTISGLVIRIEQPADHRSTEEVVREAFYNRYKPGCDEHLLLHLLRNSPGFEAWHSLVAEYDSHIIGQVLLSPAQVVAAQGAEHPVLCLGPVCVLPAASGRGIGSALMQAAITLARGKGERALLLLGNPAYYRRFGFLPASSLGIHLPGQDSQEEAPYFMALPLFEGALAGVQGSFHESPLFAVDPQALAAFDSSFPPRQQLKLPGQLG